MSETKSSHHTPGPWEVEATKYSHAFVLTNEGGRIGEIHTSPTINYNRQDERKSSAEEARANARLIAAAPKLLASCKAAYHELRVRCGYKPGDAAYDDLASVIFEATGEKMGDRT